MSVAAVELGGGDTIHTYPRPELKVYKPYEPCPEHSTMPQNFDKHVVIPDIHGEAKTLKKVINTYYDMPDVGFVFLGDVVDKSNAQEGDSGVRDTLEIVRQLGNRAVLLQANHEWTMLAAMFEKKEILRRAIASGSWLGTSTHKSTRTFVQHEANTLSAYDIGIVDQDKSPEALKARMQEFGHLAVLTSAVPYYETDTWIATHAGLHPTQLWSRQKEELELAKHKMNNGMFEDTLRPQWSSFRYAMTERVDCSDKIVISGHAHVIGPWNVANGLTLKKRKTNDGKRIRLATRLNNPNSEPLLVWEDWTNDNDIVVVPKE